MKNILLALWDQVRRQPAAYTVTGLGALGAVIIAFGHLTPAEAATLSGALTAIGTIVTALLARPVNFTVISGAAAVLLQSLVLLNVHLSSGEIAALVTALNFVLGIIGIPTVAESLVSIRQKQAAAVRRQPLDYDRLAAKVAARLAPTQPHPVQPDKM